LRQDGSLVEERSLAAESLKRRRNGGTDQFSKPAEPRRRAAQSQNFVGVVPSSSSPKSNRNSAAPADKAKPDNVSTQAKSQNTLCMRPSLANGMKTGKTVLPNGLTKIPRQQPSTTHCDPPEAKTSCSGDPWVNLPLLHLCQNLVGDGFDGRLGFRIKSGSRFRLDGT